MKNNEKELKVFLCDVAIYFKLSFLKNSSHNIHRP